MINNRPAATAEGSPRATAAQSLTPNAGRRGTRRRRRRRWSILLVSVSERTDRVFGVLTEDGRRHVVWTKIARYYKIILYDLSDERSLRLIGEPGNSIVFLERIVKCIM